MQALERISTEQVQWPGRIGSACESAELKLLQALGCASRVRTHLEFFQWLQKYVRPFLPHSTLVAAWGDLTNGNLRYDIASSVPGLSTQEFMEYGGLSDKLSRLFLEVCQAGCSWLALDDGRVSSREILADKQFPFHDQLMGGTWSMLAYTMRDERGESDAMYVFHSTTPPRQINPVVLDLIMPHIDAALRRVRCLEVSRGAASTALQAKPCDLSCREKEVLHWVSQGKSNEEIGAILGISHNTVKNHLKRVFNKLGVTSRSQAVRLFVQHSLGHP